MDVNDFIELRCAHNRVRAATPRDERLTMEQLAALAVVVRHDGPAAVSLVSDTTGAPYQTCITRLATLASLELCRAVRTPGGRGMGTLNLLYEATPRGVARLKADLQALHEHLRGNGRMGRLSPTQLMDAVAATGAHRFQTATIALLILGRDAEHTWSVGALARAVAVSQATMSRAAISLERGGLAERSLPRKGLATDVSITDAGLREVILLHDRIRRIPYKRPEFETTRYFA